MGNNSCNGPSTLLKVQFSITAKFGQDKERPENTKEKIKLVIMEYQLIFLILLFCHASHFANISLVHINCMTLPSSLFYSSS